MINDNKYHAYQVVTQTRCMSPEANMAMAKQKATKNKECVIFSKNMNKIYRTYHWRLYKCLFFKNIFFINA